MTSNQVIQSLQSEISKKDTYIELLEKVNQQISYTWIPAMVVIASLTLLFAVGAIVVGIVIYRQGRDYKNKLEKNAIAFNKKAESLLAIEMKNRKKQIEKTMTKFNKLLKKFESRHQELEKKKPKTGEDMKDFKKEIREEMEKLRQEKENITKSSGLEASSTLNILPTSPFSNQVFQSRCLQCGKPLPPGLSLNFCENCLSGTSDLIK